MTNTELKEIINTLVIDEDELNKIIILEGNEFADGAIGLTEDNHIIYDYELLIKSLMNHNNWTKEEAMEWLDYNTLGSIPYMASKGNEPIIMMHNFANYK